MPGTRLRVGTGLLHSCQHSCLWQDVTDQLHRTSVDQWHRLMLPDTAFLAELLCWELPRASSTQLRVCSSAIPNGHTGHASGAQREDLEPGTDITTGTNGHTHGQDMDVHTCRGPWASRQRGLQQCQARG